MHSENNRFRKQKQNTNTNSMSSRKRSGSGSKRPKEKVVYIYEMIFRADFEDPTKTNAEFWYEFFLLQPNVESLENEMTKLSCEQLIALKNHINLLFCRCIEMLDSGMWLSIFVFGQIFSILINKKIYFVHFQIIRNGFATVCKHYARYFMRFLSGTQQKQALMSSARYLTLMRLKIK